MTDQANAPQPPRFALIPGVWFVLSLGAMLLLARLLPVPVIVLSPWNLLGAVPILLGIVVAVAGQQQFQRRGTTIKPFHVSSTLVTNGVFAFSRNPMYLSMTTVLFGVAVLLGVLVPFVVPVCFAAWLRFAFITHEERMMEERFGDEYRAYKKRIRRWL